MMINILILVNQTPKRCKYERIGIIFSILVKKRHRWSLHGTMNYPSMSTAAFLAVSLAVVAYLKKKKSNEERETVCDVDYQGTCHCGAVTFSVKAPCKLTVWRCDCSICMMKRNEHFIVPSSRFKLLSGESDLTTYEFNSRTAKVLPLFCYVGYMFSQ